MSQIGISTEKTPPTGTDNRPAMLSHHDFPQLPNKASPTTPPTKPSYSNIAKTYPKKEQAIVLTALDNTKLKEYLFAIGKIVNPKFMIAASRISRGRICVYFDSKSTADNFIENHGGITINDTFITARKLVNPTKKVILSNIHPTIPDSFILEQLQNHNLQPVSSVKTLHIRLEDNDLFNHKKLGVCFLNVFILNFQFTINLKYNNSQPNAPTLFKKLDDFLFFTAP